MSLKRLAKPRFIIGLVALLMVSMLTFTETIESSVGVALIIGILTAFGAYYAEPPRKNP